MIINIIKFKPAHKLHIRTFDGNAEHWDGTCAKRTALRGAIRKHYLREQENHCAYCDRLRQDVHGYNWDIDHIIPKSTHPCYTYEPKNFAITCKECNIIKDNQNVLASGVNASGDYPQNDIDYLIIHPHIDDYAAHMNVNYNHKLQVYHTPKTAKGMETFALCGLNRFTEEIAKTSEFIKESDISIGFSDETFNKFYEGFQKFTSLYISNHEVQSRFFARYLAEQAGVETDDVLAAIEALRIYQQNQRKSNLRSSLGTGLLPPPEQDEE